MRSARRSGASSSITSTVVIAAADRQRETERGATAVRLFAPHVSAVRGDERAHDREAEPGTGRVGPRVDPHELFEDVLALGHGYAGAVIGDPHLDAVATARGRDEDLRTGWREPERVLEQVAEDLLHHLDVDLDVGHLTADVETHPVRTCERAQSSHRRLREVPECHRLTVHFERAGADPAELEDVGDEPLEPVGLVVDGVEQLRTVGRRRDESAATAGWMLRP